MEKIDNIAIKEKENSLFSRIDNIPRCLKCNLISSINLYYNEGKPFIYYFCENNHKGDISLDEYINNYNNNSLIKQKCEDCNKNQNEVKSDFFYCCKCNKFRCSLCLTNHPNNKMHNLIDFKRYDSLCKTHSNFFLAIA